MQNSTSVIQTFLFVLRDTFRIMCKYPIMAVPMLISFSIYAIISIYFAYDFNWKSISDGQALFLLFLIILAYSIIYSVGSLILLEMIQHVETGNKPCFWLAVTDTFTKNFVKAFPIMLSWAIIWFVIEILSALTSRARRRLNQSSSAYNIAQSLSGYGNSSLASLSFSMLKSGIRIIVFFIYPAIAWENEKTIDAIKKGFVGIKNTASELFTGFFTCEILLAIIFLPVAFMFWQTSENNVVYSDFVWCCVIVYIACVFSFYLYLQQMLAAILYLWQMNWRKAVLYAVAKDLPEPSLSDIKMPNLLDNVPDLFFLRKY